MSIEHEIKQFILSNYLFTQDENAVANTDSLMKKGIIDSTGVLELIMHIEDRYGIKVRDEEMIPENLDSVQAVAGFVERKRTQ